MEQIELHYNNMPHSPCNNPVFLAKVPLRTMVNATVCPTRGVMPLQIFGRLISPTTHVPSLFHDACFPFWHSTWRRPRVPILYSRAL